MPKYRVTLSDGRMVTLEADHDPTEADVMLALGSQSAPHEARIGANLHQEAKIGAGPPLGEDFNILGIPINVKPEGKEPNTSLIGFGGEHPGGNKDLPKTGEIGIPPEAVLMGPLQAGRAMLNPALSAAGKATAGVSTIVQHAAPLVKYEIAKHVLRSVGVPSEAADVLAFGLSGYRKGGAPTATSAAETAAADVPAATTAAPAATEALASPSARPIFTVPEVLARAKLMDQGHTAEQASQAILAQRGGPSPSSSQPVSAPVTPAAAPSQAPTTVAPSPVGPFNPTQAIQQARDAFTAAGEVPLKAEASNAMKLIRRGKSPEDAIRIVMGNRPAAPAATVVARDVPKLTSDEVKAGMDLIARGKTPQEALDAIIAQRKFREMTGTLTDTDVRRAIDTRNAQGQIKTPSAQTAQVRRMGL